MVLVCAFVIACFSLWPNKVYRTVLIVLAIPIGVYAMLTLSMLTVGGLLIGSVTFVAYRYLRTCGKGQKGPLLLLLMIAIGMYGAIPVVEKTLREEGKTGDFLEMPGTVRTGDGEITVLRMVSVTRNIAERVATWKFYIDEIARSGDEWVFGHETPPDRERYPSAYNYYLDFVYNFGVVALVPIMWLIASTLWKSGRNWKDISANPDFFALLGAVLFLVLVDNSLTVGLRQPYPGIVTFFLWGVLLSRLSALGRTAGTHGSE